MTLPFKDFNEVADEAALIAAIKSVADAAGWTTYAAGTTPAGTTWFQSPGSDGLSNIVGALQVGSGNRIRAYTAADLDTFSFVSASVGGYVNNDAGGLSTPVVAPTADADTVWRNRDAGSVYRFAAVADLDGIAALVRYQSPAFRESVGIVYIGKTRPIAGRCVDVQAKALIASVTDAGGTTRTVELDRDITTMLKDPAEFGAQDPYGQRLFFQCVAAGVGDATDFAMTDRIPIESGSLTTVSGRTRFNIDHTLAAKLGSRYDNLRGAGDIVRIMAEPTVVICAADDLEGQVISPTNSSILGSWDAYAGQGASLKLETRNAAATHADEMQPSRLSNRHMYYEWYVSTEDVATGLIAQADNEGEKCVGALHHLAIFSPMSIAEFGYVEIDGNPDRRYRIIPDLTPDGIGTPSGFGAGATVAFGIRG